MSSRATELERDFAYSCVRQLLEPVVATLRDEYGMSHLFITHDPFITHDLAVVRQVVDASMLSRSTACEAFVERGAAWNVD